MFRTVRNTRWLPCGHLIKHKQRVKRIAEPHAKSAGTAPIICPTCKTRQDIPSKWVHDT